MIYDYSNNFKNLKARAQQYDQHAKTSQNNQTSRGRKHGEQFFFRQANMAEKSSSFVDVYNFLLEYKGVGILCNFFAFPAIVKGFSKQPLDFVRNLQKSIPSLALRWTSSRKSKTLSNQWVTTWKPPSQNFGTLPDPLHRLLTGSNDHHLP